MYKAKILILTKRCKRLKIIVFKMTIIMTVISMRSKNITTVLKRVWILLKACLNALIMKRKRLEVTHERYRKSYFNYTTFKQ